MAIDRISTRQLDLGPASYFEVLPESPAGSQVSVQPGFLYSGALSVHRRAAVQLTAGIPGSTTGRRYDLVFVDSTGLVGLQSGNEHLLADPDFSGAPGWTGVNPGPTIQDNIIPVAWVEVTAVFPTSATVTTSDIYPIAGIHKVSRDIDGYIVEKTALGGVPLGASDVVTAVFAGESELGSPTVPGIIVVPLSNVVDLLNLTAGSVRDELIHTTGARIYGRVTWAASVWTLSYYYLNSSGVETAIATIETETSGGAPTDILLAGVRKTFSRNDPSRPLFATVNGTVVSDQIVGDIPSATTTLEGKVELAVDLENAANVVVQGNDQRVNTPIQGDGVAGRFSHVVAGSNIVLADVAGQLEIKALPTIPVEHLGAIYSGAFVAVGGIDRLIWAAPYVSTVLSVGAAGEILGLSVGGVYRVSVTFTTKGASAGVNVGIYTPAADVTSDTEAQCHTGDQSATLHAVVTGVLSFDIGVPPGGTEIEAVLVKRTHISVLRIA